MNIGGIKTSGVDVSTHYKFPSTSAGDFKVGLDWTFTKQYVVTQPFGSGALSSQELSGCTTGGNGGSGDRRFPEAACYGYDLTWNSGDWSATWAMTYVSHMIEDCNALFGTAPGAAGALIATRCSNQNGTFPFDSGTGAGEVVPTNHIGATTYHDVSATYHADGINTDFTFGIRNLFDKVPPIAMSAFANSFLPTYYRAPGRFLFGRVGVKF